MGRTRVGRVRSDRQGLKYYGGASACANDIHCRHQDEATIRFLCNFDYVWVLYLLAEVRRAETPSISNAVNLHNRSNSFAEKVLVQSTLVLG